MEARRLTGKAAIKEAIQRLREKADNLEKLVGEIPDDLSPEADTALWNMAIDISHKN